MSVLVGAFLATLGWAMFGWLDLGAFVEFLKNLF